MEIFSKDLEVADIKTILKEQCSIENIDTIVFKETPSMIWLEFTHRNTPLRVIHHQKVERYGFEGSLTKIEINSKVRSFVSEDTALMETLSKMLVESVGGIIINFSDDCLEGFDRPGEGNSSFLLKQLLLHGVEDEEISNTLEAFLNKNKIKVPTTN